MYITETLRMYRSLHFSAGLRCRTREHKLSYDRFEGQDHYIQGCYPSVTSSVGRTV